MHTDARTDRKLAALSNDDFRLWFNLLLYSAEQDTRGSVDISEPALVAVECGVSEDALAAGIDRIRLLRLVAISDSILTFKSFGKRQSTKPSDSAEQTRERKRRQREGAAQETCHADVTPCHADVTKCHATEEEEEEDKEGEKNARARATTAPVLRPDSDTIPSAKSAWPDCLTSHRGITIRHKGMSFPTPKAFILTAAERAWGILDPLTLGEMAAAITGGCIPGCSHSPDQAAECGHMIGIKIESKSTAKWRGSKTLLTRCWTDDRKRV